MSSNKDIISPNKMINSYHVLCRYLQIGTVGNPKAQTILTESQQCYYNSPLFQNHLQKLFCQGYHCQTMALIT